MNAILIHHKIKYYDQMQEFGSKLKEGMVKARSSSCVHRKCGDPLWQGQELLQQLEKENV